MTLLLITAIYLTIGTLLAATSPDRAFLATATNGNPAAAFSLSTYLLAWPAHTVGTLLHHTGRALRK